MRRLFAALFISLDGVVQSPDQWQFDNFDEGMMEAMTAALANEDTVLLGRVTYQEWAPYWPNSQDEPFASFINRTPKYVVSTTLDKTEWGNFAPPTLIKANVAEAVAALKQQPGKDIGVAGSPTLVESLLHANLLDDLTLMIHPVVVGHGKRLFNDGSALKRLKLADSKITPSGVALLTYVPRKS
jgi:dihydrofolate reductase